MREHRVCIAENSVADFNNAAAYCVGTGRMGLALHREYQDQLKVVQKLCGFKHIRGHGLFCDDMAVYQVIRDDKGTERETYCFTYLDRVMDSYIECGLKPFLELGFMPSAMASGDQTVFYWEGNVTPPANEEKWTGLVRATLRHLCDRYGAAEVSQWPCEVWNEPNLKVFWKDADKQAYLRLYEITARTVKSEVPGMRVGGPAICGGDGSQEWIKDFLDYCLKKDLPVDFVTRHAYMGETPTHQGRYLYHTMRTVSDLISEMQASRDIIDSFEAYRGIPMYITEFNTSYNPFCPIHDTLLNAATVAGLLARLGDVAASYSYWTFGDVFEEQGVPSSPFHGGFGLMANGMIPKPTLWAFRFFNNLTGSCVYRDEHLVIMRREDGAYEGVAWNLCEDELSKEDPPLHITVELPCAQQCVLLERTVDEQHGNPLPAWMAMGQPASLNDEQLAFLRQTARPECRYSHMYPSEGIAKLHLCMGPNQLTHFVIKAANDTPDFGYDPQMYL